MIREKNSAYIEDLSGKERRNYPRKVGMKKMKSCYTVRKPDIKDDLTTILQEVKMKKRIFAVIGILMAALLISCGNAGSSESSSEKRETTEEKTTENTTENATEKNMETEATTSDEYQLYLDINYEQNAFLSKYDIEIWLDDEEVGNVKNGKTFTKLLTINGGSHELSFYKSGDQTIKASKKIKLESDVTVSCKLSSKSTGIDVSDYSLEKSVTGKDLEMTDVTGKTLEKAVNVLKEIGFSNINEKSDDGSMILWPANWIVTEQNIAPGEVNDKNVEIILTCRKKEASEETEKSETTKKESESEPSENTKTEPASETTKAEPTEPPVPMGHANALKSAQTYLAFSAFSYQGLIDQLLYEGFSQEEADYAAQNCKADWNEQALKSAQNYLDFSAFSRQGLIDQLVFEQFSQEQAVYGVDNCHADWNEQAVKSAKSYLEYSSFSRQGLIDQLIFEGFTPEQAEYGVTQNGY